MREMVVNRGSCLPSTAKLYRTRLGPWRISSAGTRKQFAVTHSLSFLVEVRIHVTA